MDKVYPPGFKPTKKEYPPGFVPAAADTVLDESHPALDFKNRALLKNIAENIGPHVVEGRLRDLGFETKTQPNEEVVLRQPGEKEYRRIDPSPKGVSIGGPFKGATLSQIAPFNPVARGIDFVRNLFYDPEDVTDVGGDVLKGGATAAADIAVAAANPAAAPITVPITTGLVAGGTEAALQGIGKMAGLKTTPEEIAKSAALEGAITAGTAGIIKGGGAAFRALKGPVGRGLEKVGEKMGRPFKVQRLEQELLKRKAVEGTEKGILSKAQEKLQPLELEKQAAKGPYEAAKATLDEKQALQARTAFEASQVEEAETEKLMDMLKEAEKKYVLKRKVRLKSRSNLPVEGLGKMAGTRLSVRDEFPDIAYGFNARYKADNPRIVKIQQKWFPQMSRATGSMSMKEANSVLAAEIAKSPEGAFKKARGFKKDLAILMLEEPKYRALIKKGKIPAFEEVAGGGGSSRAHKVVQDVIQEITQKGSIRVPSPEKLAVKETKAVYQRKLANLEETQKALPERQSVNRAAAARQAVQHRLARLGVGEEHPFFRAAKRAAYRTAPYAAGGLGFVASGYNPLAALGAYTAVEAAERYGPRAMSFVGKGLEKIGQKLLSVPLSETTPPAVQGAIDALRRAYSRGEVQFKAALYALIQNPELKQWVKENLPD